MIIYVLDDGETYTISEPTPVAVTPEQLTRIESGEKVYQVIPDWDKLHPPCNCVKCTADRAASRKIVDAQNEADDFFVNVGIAAAEALKAKGSECEECGGLGHTIGFEGPKKIKYPCESCATGDDFFINAGIAAREALKAKGGE